MIAKIAIPIILAIILSHLYFDFTVWRHYRPRWKRALCWLVPLALVCFVGKLALQPNYFPENPATLDVFLCLLMLYVVPITLLALLFGLMRLLKVKARWPRIAAGIACAVLVIAYGYGSTVGFSQFEVRRVELAFDDLPPAFDGYRMVVWSDAHVGTLVGSRQHILQRCVDSINAQQADMVAFVGDLQNMRPEEIVPHVPLLSSIHARDGVYSVLGNHDYPEYLDTDEAQKVACLGKTVTTEEEMGWKVLRNTFFFLRRGNDSIVVSGMENDGEGRFPQLGNVSSALYGLSRKTFVVMLEHDPTSWRRKILPRSHAQLTLSGHTHAGQMHLFGWSPASLIYREYEGLYEQPDGRKLFITRGLGGVVPFRLFTPGEIVVITLKSNKVKEIR